MRVLSEYATTVLSQVTAGHRYLTIPVFVYLGEDSRKGDRKNKTDIQREYEWYRERQTKKKKKKRERERGRTEGNNSGRE